MKFSFVGERVVNSLPRSEVCGGKGKRSCRSCAGEGKKNNNTKIVLHSCDVASSGAEGGLNPRRKEQTLYTLDLTSCECDIM